MYGWVYSIMLWLRIMRPDHSELISTLTELYTLLDTLAILPDDARVLLPPHPADSFNVDALLEAGYTREAVDVLLQLPYLSDEAFEFLPDTSAICWPQDGAADDDDLTETYLADRGIFPSVNDELMPPSAFKLSFTNIYHYIFVYDTASGLVHPWKPFEDLEDVIDYRHVPGKPAREVFGPVISAYRQLEYLGVDGRVDFETQQGFVDLLGLNMLGPADWTERSRLIWQKGYKEWQALRKVREMYLKYGWNVTAAGSSQPSFRRDEFIVRRDSYWEEVKIKMERLEDEVEDGTRLVAQS